MARNKVMTVWTAIVTAFLALCTALGLITTTAAAASAAPQTEAARSSAETVTALPAISHRAWPRATSLPPTMKQRIRAEAHGKSPSCRHRPLTNTTSDTGDASNLVDHHCDAGARSSDTQSVVDGTDARDGRGGVGAARVTGATGATRATGVTGAAGATGTMRAADATGTTQAVGATKATGVEGTTKTTNYTAAADSTDAAGALRTAPFQR